MRKFLFSALAALGLVLASQQTAPAWINWNFGAGFNWQWQSGGNNLLWGAFRNGAPCNDPYGAPGHGGFFQPAPVDYGFQTPPPAFQTAPPQFQAPAPTPARSAPAAGTQAQPASFPMYHSMPQYFYPVYYGHGW